MAYEVKSPILGFEDTKEVEFQEIDLLFSSMKDTHNEQISFTLVNPFLLREYDFEISDEIKELLCINDDSKISVYNTLLIQKPLEKSLINFLAPIIVNHDTKQVAQIILDPKKYPDYGMTETIESYKER
ncbi:MAG: flagellar assembly protein FliW [Sulfurimonas sp.]